jgi:hypothetical protein
MTRFREAGIGWIADFRAQAADLDGAGDQVSI